MVESKVLVVIPARGGSVRVPKKNIKILNGNPLIAYAIEAAKNSKTVDRIVVSTDDDEIRDTAIKFGAEVPFTRPAHLSEDVPTEDVVIHAINWLSENEKYYPGIVVCLEPPKPFRKAEHIDRCVHSILADETIDSAITVNNIRGNRPEWMLYVDEDNLIKPYTSYFKKQGEALMRFPASQEFERLYQSNGIVFACRVGTLKRYGSLVGQKCAAVEINYSEMFDLDYPEDFQLCEILMKKRSKC
ncbi:cytidylyltransferase domain-containing protein [Chloroflexota bacterium]